MPQKHVAVASSSLDQPSWAKLAMEKYGFDLLTAAVMVLWVVVEAMPKYFYTVFKP